MHTTTTQPSALPSLPSLLRSPRVAKSPYPVSRKPMAPVTPGRKAYKRLKSMLSSFKPIKSVKSQETTAVVKTKGDKEHVPSGLLALEHTNDPYSQHGDMPMPTHVPGGRLAPEHVIVSEPQITTLQFDEYHGWAQVAKTSAKFLSTLLACPEVLPSADPTEVNPDLAHFVALALDRSRSPLCVHQHALYLIWRVKCLNVDFQPRHAHGTYLTALMLASKHSLDIDYPIDDWAWIGQDIFQPAQLRDNEWRMCERLEWKLTVRPMDLVKFIWTIEVGYGDLTEGPPMASGPIESEARLGGMFAASVASSLSSLSTSSSCSMASPWSGWGVNTPSGSGFSTPVSNGPICGSTPSPLILA